MATDKNTKWLAAIVHRPEVDTCKLIINKTNSEENNLIIYLSDKDILLSKNISKTFKKSNIIKCVKIPTGKELYENNQYKNLFFTN